MSTEYRFSTIINCNGNATLLVFPSLPWYKHIAYSLLIADDGFVNGRYSGAPFAQDGPKDLYLKEVEVKIFDPWWQKLK